MFKPINRCEIQYAFDDGYMRWVSPGRQKPFTTVELVAYLREVADAIDAIEQRRATLAAAHPKEPV